MQRGGMVTSFVVAIALAIMGAIFIAADRRAGANDAPGVAVAAPAAEACSVPTAGRTRRIATAKLIVEYNATDEDLGVHGAFEDDGWSRLCVLDPNGRPVLHVGPRGRLLDLTVAGIFFESREPPVSEFGFADLKAAFPEGGYTVRGQAFDGTILEGSATFTHDVPAAPVITAPRLAEEPKDALRAPLPPAGLVIDWNDVTSTVEGDPVKITGYEVIVTKEDHDDPHGFSRPIYDVHVPPTVDRLPVPGGFLEPETVYELEVLALEYSGNQTITVGFFATA
jgi:hypothetical protein